jgi:hypothetical protein
LGVAGGELLKFNSLKYVALLAELRKTVAISFVTLKILELYIGSK